MGFGSSQLLKSLGGLGRSKTADVLPEEEGPSDMAERLARLRQSALANDAEGRRMNAQTIAPAWEEGQDERQADAADGADGETATNAPSMPWPEKQPASIAPPEMRIHILEPMAGSDESNHADAIAWLEGQDPAVWHYVAEHWDWDRGVEPLAWIARQDRCDAGTAASLFWKSGESEDYLPFGDAEPTEDGDIMIAEMAEHIAHRFEAEEFAPMQYAFDEALVLAHFPERLEKLFREERIDWDAYKVPTRSTGELVLIDRFDRAVEEELDALLKDTLQDA